MVPSVSTTSEGRAPIVAAGLMKPPSVVTSSRSPAAPAGDGSAGDGTADDGTADDGRAEGPPPAGAGVEGVPDEAPHAVATSATSEAAAASRADVRRQAGGRCHVRVDGGAIGSRGWLGRFHTVVVPRSGLAATQPPVPDAAPPPRVPEPRGRSPN